MLGTATTVQISVQIGSVGLLPKYMEYSAFVTFLTHVLPCPFLSGTRPGPTVGTIFTLYGSNDMFPHKKVPFGARTIDAVIWRKYVPKPPKSGPE